MILQINAFQTELIEPIPNLRAFGMSLCGIHMLTDSVTKESILQLDASRTCESAFPPVVTQVMGPETDASCAFEICFSDER